MSIAETVARIRREIDLAALAAGRDPKEIQLCAATKMNDAGAVRQEDAVAAAAVDLLADFPGLRAVKVDKRKAAFALRLIAVRLAAIQQKGLSHAQGAALLARLVAKGAGHHHHQQKAVVNVALHGVAGLAVEIANADGIVQHALQLPGGGYKVVYRGILQRFGIQLHLFHLF